MKCRGWYDSGFDVRAALSTSMTKLLANVAMYQNKNKKKKTMNIFILYRFKMAPHYLIPSHREDNNIHFHT